MTNPSQVEAAFIEGQNGKQNVLTHYNKQQIDQLNDLIRYKKSSQDVCIGPEIYLVDVMITR